MSTNSISYTFGQTPSIKDLSCYDIEEEQNLFAAQVSNLTEFSKTSLCTQSAKMDVSDLQNKDRLFQYVVIANHPSLSLKSQIYQRGVSKQLGLTECADCPYGQRHGESGQYNVRASLEERILSRIETKFKVRTDKFCYLSVGSGGCFQDWMILSKLLLMGYKNLEIHLVDIEYQHSTSNTIKKTMEVFFTTFPGVVATVHFYNGLGDFSEAQAQSKAAPCNVALAIDWESSANTQNKSSTIRFAPDGFAYYNKAEPSIWDITGGATKIKPLSNKKW